MAWLDPRKSGYYLRDRNPEHCEPLGKISHKEARTLLHAFEVRKAEDRVQGGALGRHMGEVYAQYLAYLDRENYSPKTIRIVKQDLVPWISTLQRVKQLAPDRIKAWRDELMAKEWKEGKRYAIDTVAHRLRTLKAFCGWMVEEKILKQSPFEISIPEGRKDAGRALSGKDVLALFAHWPKSRVGKHEISHLFFHIVFYGGTRLTEVLGDEELEQRYPGAMYENVDRDRSILKLEQTKAGESREVALPKFIVKMIPEGKGPIFRGKISAWVLRKHLAQAIAAAGISGRFRIHDGRVTSATEWARKNQDPRGAMDQFGWKTEKMAMHYTKVATEERIARAQNITYK